MKFKIDIIGKKYGKLTVISRNKKNSYGRYTWNCKCDCGKDKIAFSYDLTGGNLTSCGCDKKVQFLGKTFDGITVIEYLGTGLNGIPGGWWLVEDQRGFQKKMRTSEINKGHRIKKCVPTDPKDKKLVKKYETYQRDSKQKNRDFQLTFKEAVKLFTSPCEYCGQLGGVAGNSHIKETKFNGIDRIDNREGYNITNTVSCCYTCNRAKNNMGIIDFVNYLENLIEFRLSKRINNEKIRIT